MDHFEVFGLPRRLVLDEAELQRRFYELAKEGVDIKSIQWKAE